jgi:hypothetical protein
MAREPFLVLAHQLASLAVQLSFQHDAARGHGT